MSRSLGLHLICLLLAVSLLGCGGGATVKTVPVKGKVTLDGAPVDGASVTFIPENTDTGRGAAGLTDATGQFKLTTSGGGEGAVPGKYTVGITKAVGEGQPAPAASQEEAMKQIREKMASGGMRSMAAPPKVKNVIPLAYGAPVTSGLVAEIKPSGENELTFELKSSGPAK